MYLTPGLTDKHYENNYPSIVNYLYISPDFVSSSVWQNSKMKETPQKKSFVWITKLLVDDFFIPMIEAQKMQVDVFFFIGMNCIYIVVEKKIVFDTIVQVVPIFVKIGEKD